MNPHPSGGNAPECHQHPRGANRRNVINTLEVKAPERGDARNMSNASAVDANFDQNKEAYIGTGNLDKACP